MEEFLRFMASPAGIAVFCVVAAAAVVLLLALNYRFFAKAALDVLFGALIFAVVSPVFAVCALVAKRRAGRCFDVSYAVGKGGRPIKVPVFADRPSGGAVFGNALKYLPMLSCVVAGRMSLVGPVPASLADGALIPEQFDGRFAVRPGMIAPSAGSFGERLSFEEMFAADCRYAENYSLIGDIKITLLFLLRAVRGEGQGYLSRASGGYAAELLAEGKITEEQLREAEALGGRSAADRARGVRRAG